MLHAPPRVLETFLNQVGGGDVRTAWGSEPQDVVFLHPVGPDQPAEDAGGRHHLHGPHTTGRVRDPQGEAVKPVCQL